MPGWLWRRQSQPADPITVAATDYKSATRNSAERAAAVLDRRPHVLPERLNACSSLIAQLKLVVLPEKAQADLPFNGAAGVPAIRLAFPVISPANAAVAPAPVTVSTQAAAANHFRIW